MKQLQSAYKDKDSFSRVLSDWKIITGDAKGRVLFHIFSDMCPPDDITTVRGLVEEYFPNADYVGAGASGILYEGKVSAEPLVISMTYLEDEGNFVFSREIEIEGLDMDSFRKELSSMKGDFDGVKAAEIILTIDSIPIPRVCEALEEVLPGDVPIFGGGAFGDNKYGAYVYKKGGSVSEHALILTFFGGKDFYAKSTVIVGWKPLGAPLEVTKSKYNVLYELDGEPAYKIYQHYLKIPNDEHMFYNALEFPFAVSMDEGRSVFRHALSVNDDGSLVMSTDIPEGSTLHVTYGDPVTILRNVRESSVEIGGFYPDVISIFDCFGRKTFWGDDASRETLPFFGIAPTYGFCTAGELCREGEGHSLRHHNLTLVITGMREGAPKEHALPEVLPELVEFDSTISLVSRLANFINTATSELMWANIKLSQMAVTDRLTSLFNRGEIQRRISERIDDCIDEPVLEKATSLVMLDLDDFKHINDTYGHAEGDNVLRKVSSLIKETVDGIDVPDACSGRWGGEEFMIMLPATDSVEAARFAEKLRHDISQLVFDQCGTETVSIGVAQAKKGEMADPLESRVDEALYEAKRTGKNKVVVSEEI